MGCGIRTEPDTRVAVARDAADESKNIAGRRRRPAHRLELLVMRGKRGEELSHGSTLERLGHETLHGNVAELDRQSHLASENHDFSRDVHSGEVVARIRLGVPQLSRMRDELGEGALSV